MYFCDVLVLYMKKLHIIVLLFLGMFLMPTSAIACGSKTSKKSCDKELSCSKSEKEECCCTDKSNSEENTGCNGNCDNSLCECASTCTTPTVSFLSEINFETRIFNFLTVEKVNFSNSSLSISDGYYSIWLIPKIS